LINIVYYDVVFNSFLPFFDKNYSDDSFTVKKIMMYNVINRLYIVLYDNEK